VSATRRKEKRLVLERGPGYVLSDIVDAVEWERRKLEKRISDMRWKMCFAKSAKMKRKRQKNLERAQADLLALVLSNS
jgi:hypothetical protein